MSTKVKTHRSFVVLYLNGKRHEVGGNLASMMLADYLRYKLQLYGTKIVCAEGDCGACSVLRLYKGAFQKASHYQVINACITTVAQMDCSSLVTIDFFKGDITDPVQTAMVNCHGSQCGFCTPGFVVAIKALIEKKLDRKEISISQTDAKNALTGNLCRCTGYKQILDAALSVPMEKSRALAKETWHRQMEKELVEASKKPVLLNGEGYFFAAPLSLNEASKFSDYKILGAGTDLGVGANKLKEKFQRLLSLHLIQGLYKVEKKGKRVRVGSRVTLEQLRQELKSLIPEFSRYLDVFASPQIKNAATLTGNLCNASPIGDTLPFLLAMNATIHTHSKAGSRSITIEDFFLGYRKTALKKGEIVTSIEFDIPSKEERLYLYKTSQRKDLDISAVNGAIRFGKDPRIALGGIAAIPLRLEKIEDFISRSENIEQAVIEKSLSLLQDQIKPLSDVRGSSAFRRVLVSNFLKTAMESEMQRVTNAFP